MSIWTRADVRCAAKETIASSAQARFIRDHAGAWGQRLNNEVLHLANQGVTINEIQNVYHLPKSLEQNWAAHSYHGSEANTAVR